MNIWQRLFRSKDSQARIALSFRQVGNPISTPRNYEGFSREGYQKNVTVYRCVQLIAKACAGIEWELYNQRVGGKPVEIETHELLDLLDRPNPMQGRGSFFEYFVAYYALTGNTFVEAVRPRPTLPPMELWPTRPDKMQIVPGPRGYPMKYIFSANEMKKEWTVDQITLKSDMFHMKSFHPLNDWWGMSPLEAALYSLDSSNAGQRWNLALLQNSATPSGVLQVKSSDTNPGGMLSEEQFSRLKNEIQNEYSGSRSAGRPMLLEGGMEWKQISMSPKDMEFLKLKEVTSIDIAEAFGVPPEMLGLGQKTFNNYKEARMSFYEDTVLPLMDFIQTELNNWLVPMFGETLYLCYDKDDIEALQPKREAKFASVKDANFLTQNEKREAAGYEPKDGWDVFLIGQDLVMDPVEYMGMNEETPAEGDTNDETQDMGEVQQPPEMGEQDDEESTEGNEADEESDDEQKGWKNFNLLNQNEKRSSWNKQNRKRKYLERQMARDLDSDFKEMYSDITRALKGKKEPRLAEFAMMKEIDENLPVIKRTLQRHIKYTVQEFSNVIFNEAKSLWPGIETKASRKYDDWTQRYIQKRTADAIGQIEGTTRKQVQRVVKRLTEQTILEGDSTAEMASELQEEFSSLGKSRAMLIARTEVASASNNTSLAAVRSLDVPNIVKEWVSAQDDRVRDGGKDGHGPDHESMNGVESPLDEPFAVPPDATMDGPGDMAGGASQVCNCRCVLVFKTRGD